LVPWLLALSSLCFVLGRAPSSYYEHTARHLLPTPAWVDVASLGSYTFLLLAVLPFALWALASSGTARTLLDALLILTTLALFSWSFLLGPALLQQHGSPLDRLVEVACPLLEITLLFCLLLVLFHGRSVLVRRVAVLPAVAVGLIVICHSIEEYQALHGAAIGTSFLDVGRSVGYLLLGAAALSARGAQRERADSEEPRQAAGVSNRGPSRRDMWWYLLPYALIPVVIVLVASVSRGSTIGDLALGVYGIGGLLIELIFIHQFVTYRDLIRYANRNARLESLASADPITGLPNHRTLVAALDGELARYRRHQQPCAVLFFDLDRFKTLNDTFGHGAGDAALREFAAVVRSGLRDSDILGRWGGEEFVAILPQTDPHAALVVAERAVTAVEAHTFWAAGGAHLTCSVGIAGYPQDEQDRDGLIGRADHAMYAAKHLGRNQVRLASDPAIATVDLMKAGLGEDAAVRRSF
jgi:diguanylate cyclase (GGDEF)-like protein